MKIPNKNRMIHIITTANDTKKNHYKTNKNIKIKIMTKAKKKLF